MTAALTVKLVFGVVRVMVSVLSSPMLTLNLPALIGRVSIEVLIAVSAVRNSADVATESAAAKVVVCAVPSSVTV